MDELSPEGLELIPDSWAVPVISEIREACAVEQQTTTVIIASSRTLPMVERMFDGPGLYCISSSISGSAGTP